MCTLWGRVEHLGVYLVGWGGAPWCVPCGVGWSTLVCTLWGGVEHLGVYLGGVEWSTLVCTLGGGTEHLGVYLVGWGGAPLSVLYLSINLT